MRLSRARSGLAAIALAGIVATLVSPRPSVAADANDQSELAVVVDTKVGPTPKPVTVPPNASDLQRALLDLSVNGVSVGTVLVLLGTNDAYVHDDDLERAGVRADRLVPMQIAGNAFVSLASIGSDASYKLDTNALSIAVTLGPEFFRPTNVDLSRRAAFDVEKPSHSGFFNYAAGYDTIGDLRFEGEAGLNIAHGLLDSLIRRDTQTGHFEGDNTSFTYDHPATGQRDVAGVAFVSADDFAGTGGVLRLVGASVSRDGPLNQSLRLTAGNALSGIAAAASTVEVYVNGVLVQRQEIAPGAFQLSNLPLQTGFNNTTVVVRDVYGRTQTYGSSLYAATDLLHRGEHTYQIAAGREINDYGLSAPFRPTDAIGRYSYGITDHLTVGMHAVAGTDLDNVGGVAAYGSRIGEFEVTGSGSSAAPYTSTNTSALVDATFVAATPAPVTVTVAPGTKRVSGDAFGAAYSYFGSLFSAGVSYVYESPLYSSLAHAALADRDVSDVRASINYVLGHGRTIALGYENDAFRDAGLARDITAVVSTRLGRSAELTTGIGSRNYRGINTPDVIVRLNFGLGSAIDAVISSETRDGENERVIDIEHTPRTPYGLAYGLQDSELGQQHSATLDLTDFTRSGDAHVFVGGAVNGPLEAQALFSGGFAFADGRIYETEPILQAYSVANVGMPGIGIESNGAFVGSSDRDGRILLTNVYPYAQNTVAVESSTLPADVTVDTVSHDFSTAYRGGNTVQFKTTRIRSYVGRLHVTGAGPTVTPAYGRLSVAVTKGSVVSDLGSSGNFYFDSLTPGHYHATATFGGGSCEFTLVVPAATTFQTNLGELTCALAK